MEYRAVIFDMDGVLIDSEMLYLRGLQKEMVKKRPWITEESLYPTVGMDSERTRVFLYQLAREPLENEAFYQELLEMYKVNDPVYFPRILYPEVPVVLASLRQRGYQIALASSSPLKTIQTMLRECELEPYFEYIISGEQFRESKPNPEIYRTAMAAIGRRPEECLVVEDSTYGVKAGVAAGATVAARLDPRFPFDQSEAAYHIHDLRDLLDILSCREES